MSSSTSTGQRKPLRQALLWGFINKPWYVGVAFSLALPCALGNPGDKAGGLEIVSLKRISQFDRNDEGCSDWKMSEPQILQAFKKMRKVTSERWGMTCEAYSC